MRTEDFRKIRLFNEPDACQTELEARNRKPEVSGLEGQEAPDRYSELYDFSPVGILSIDRKGHILESNPAAAELLGYPRAHLLNKDLHIFIKTEFHHAFKEFIGKILASQTRHHLELELCSEKGSSKYIQLAGLPLAGSHTQNKQLRIAITDITLYKQQHQEMRRLNLQLRLINKGLEKEISERKRTESELTKSELEKTLILDNADEIIAYHDTDHNLVWANKSYLGATGLSQAQLMMDYIMSFNLKQDQIAPERGRYMAIRDAARERRESAPSADDLELNRLMLSEMDSAA